MANEAASDSDFDSMLEQEETTYEDMTWSMDEDVAREHRFMFMDEQWKIIFNEQARSPIYSVEHYINYLRRFVEGKPLQSERVGGVRRPKDGISPLSYFLRRLKLDLRLSYDSFLVEFNKPPNGGIKLLIALLKQLQTGSSPVSSANQKLSTISSRYSTCSKLEDYKRNLTDEHDCLLCIKFCLRLQSILHELVNDSDALQTFVWGLLSSHVKCRITSIEILTLLLTSDVGFERVFETFTYMRLKLGESVRFKLLVSMLTSRGSSSVLFQITCMRFLNMLLNSAPSADLRVYLQEEIKMAGFELSVLEQNSQGDGLEYDDLKREIDEWTSRYINVESLLKKSKLEYQSSRSSHFSQSEEHMSTHSHVNVSANHRPQQNHELLQSRGCSQPNLSTAASHQSNSITSSRAYKNSQIGVMVTEERYNLCELENRMRAMHRQDDVTRSRRKLNVPDVSYSLSEMMHFIDTFDTYALTGDAADLLINVVRSTYEKSHMYSSNSNLPFLVSLDQLASELSNLDQCEDKLKLIGFMSHFDERVKELHQKIDSITNASNAVINKPKVKQIFEIIVEFGNRLHSWQSKSAKGSFGLSALESLSKTDISSTDKSETLLDFIVSEVNEHYVEIGDWFKHLDITVPKAVTLAVIGKQINYLKEGTAILQAEVKQRDDVHSIKDLVKTGPRKLREVEHEYEKMLSSFQQVCHVFQVEADDWEPCQLFDVIVTFAGDYEKSLHKLKQSNGRHGDWNKKKTGSFADIPIKSDLDINDNIRSSIPNLGKTNNLMDSTHLHVEENTVEQNGLFGSYKKKFNSEPAINFNDSMKTSKMGRQLARNTENTDDNWLLSPCSSLPVLSSACKNDDVIETVSSKNVEGLDIFYDEIQHETYFYPFNERQGEPDGAASPHFSPCKLAAPSKHTKSKNPSGRDFKLEKNDSVRSYSDELSEILLDFEKTLYANDNVIKPNPISSPATVIRGPVTFV